MTYDDAMILAQTAARDGKHPHEILHLMLAHLEPKWPGHVPWVETEYYMTKAFGIPLKIARAIDNWTGVSKTGALTDQDINKILAPWISRYLEESGQSQRNPSE